MIRRVSALVGSVGALLMLLPSSACTATANVHDVYMALDSDGNRRRNTFFTDSNEIDCVAELGIGRKNVTIEHSIHQIQRYDFVKNAFVDADRNVAYKESNPQPSDGIQKQSLKVLRPKDDSGDGGSSEELPYPPGRYICEVRMDGDLAGSAVFNIEFPPCPFESLAPGGKCFLFYPNGQQCPAYGLGSKENASCNCDAVKGWVCQ